jgi:hypothetical protein
MGKLLFYLKFIKLKFEARSILYNNKKLEFQISKYEVLKTGFLISVSY